MDRMTQSAFEADIIDDVDDCRLELRVEQAVPLFEIARAAYLPVRAERLDEVEALLDDDASGPIAERTRYVIRLVDGTRLRRSKIESHWYRHLSERIYIEVCHHSDKVYACYPAIYRAIKLLAPMVEDCRFFISEDYSEWVDEYRIRDGALWFQRGYADSEYAEALRNHLIERARATPDDVELARFTAWFIADHAAFLLGCIEKRNQRDEQYIEYQTGARRHLDIALHIDADCYHAVAQNGRYMQILGDNQQAGEWLTRAANLQATGRDARRRVLDPEPLLRAALVALAADDVSTAGARVASLLQMAPMHKAGLMLAGWLNARGEVPDEIDPQRFDASWRTARTIAGNLHKDDIFRADIHEALLDVFFSAWERDLQAQPKGRAHDDENRALARDLLDWAEFFRIMDAHDRHRDTSRALAQALYSRARQWSELDGEILYCMGIHHQLRPTMPDRPELFEQAIAINPDHLKSLGELGKHAHQSQDYARSAKFLARYLEVSDRVGSGGYAKGVYLNYLIDAHYRLGCQRLDARELDAAHQAFDAVLALYSRLGRSQRSFEGPLIGKGDAYALAGAHETALTYYDQALDTQQDSPYAWSSRGSCLNNMGRYEEALECYELALLVKDDYWHPYYCKACTLALTGGDRDEIIALIAKAISLEPARRSMLLDEPDFASLRDDSEFQALCVERLRL